MCIKEMAPNLFKMCTRKKLTIAQAMLDQRWTRHLKRDLPRLAVIEMVAVWEKLQGVALQPGTPDSVSWRWTADGTYTAASAYVVQFIGSTQTSYTSCIWASDAPLRCRIFAWLAVQGRCLTADMLARRGWPHNDGCTLCTAPYETAQHLLGACPMMLQVWCIILPMANLPACFPPSQDQSPLEWLSTTRPEACFPKSSTRAGTPSRSWSGGRCGRKETSAFSRLERTRWQLSSRQSWAKLTFG
ncbi:hypothetical protein QYE76_030654 [Lolium multiflorum]|uniref:Reverse transcriptase zinc-binding domain-containing protein n=1 Tax=Lolium multiflorum TaxID=4521 RepID=A0AAD8VJ06_LOLMU|nr:hypothetical protein QYE76_030654 [Lolium multiflorum]